MSSHECINKYAVCACVRELIREEDRHEQHQLKQNQSIRTPKRQRQPKQKNPKLKYISYTLSDGKRVSDNAASI